MELCHPLTVRILITNNSLAGRSGTELYVRDLALQLRALGHEPVAWSTSLGDVADELKAAGIPVTDDLAQLPFQPDIIHGQHHLDTMTALLTLPGIPAVYFCHGALPWEEMPPVFPRIHRYVAVDRPCHERIVQEAGISPEKITTLLNFVDLERFQPRPPLPDRPRRALVFSNYARRNHTLRIIHETCAEHGITLDVVGSSADNATAAPEKILPQYDLVFAKARAALEAMATGCAVIVWHTSGCGPLVTTQGFERLRAYNFGFRTADQPVTRQFLSGQIAGYNAADAAAVSRLVRSQADMRATVDRIVRIYEDALAEHRQQPPNPAAEMRAAGLYWQRMVPLIKHGPKSLPALARKNQYEKIARMADRLARWLRAR